MLTLSVLSALTAVAKERTIDISGNNTSSDYKTYSQSIRVVAGDTVNVLLARYCYFSSQVIGAGVMNLYAGRALLPWYREREGVAQLEQVYRRSARMAVSGELLLGRILWRGAGPRRQVVVAGECLRRCQLGQGEYLDG